MERVPTAQPDAGHHDRKYRLQMVSSAPHIQVPSVVRRSDDLLKGLGMGVDLGTKQVHGVRINRNLRPVEDVPHVGDAAL